MSSEQLLPCPFCGADGLEWIEKGQIVLIEHPNTDCLLADFRLELCDSDELVKVWNTRF